jgi:peptide-methionine (R)-S-oxide reductase
VKRRLLLKNWIAGAVALTPAKPVMSNMKISEIQRNWQRFLPPSASVSVESELLTLSERQWKSVLSEDQFRILRLEDTESPATSDLLFEDRPGVYLCAACDLPLFSSEMKYDSGTGWPSFFTSIPGALETRVDSYLFSTSTEYHCARCGGHQGHLFEDGPEPTRERWCNNGIALRFIPLRTK